ncbi:MAG TPA: hypothetical protein VGO53_02390, partial [Steroidobacteraceae bacterium]|nr:hypothetical protein [Steroidobacteraceae bacterium]
YPMDYTSSIDPDVVRLRRTLLAAECRIRELEAHHQPMLPNALLILAVQRMIERDGASRTASILCRLADTVQTGPAPPPERAVDLSSFDS